MTPFIRTVRLHIVWHDVRLRRGPYLPQLHCKDTSMARTIQSSRTLAAETALNHRGHMARKLRWRQEVREVTAVEFSCPWVNRKREKAETLQKYNCVRVELWKPTKYRVDVSQWEELTGPASNSTAKGAAELKKRRHAAESPLRSSGRETVHRTRLMWTFGSTAFCPR